MRTLVAFFTQTGRTKEVAEAIFEELPDNKELKELTELSNIDDYDLSFIGFPIHAFGPAKPAKEFLEKNASGKKVALFVTHAAPEEEAESEGWLDTCREAASGAEIVGFFHCQGELAEPIAQALLSSGNERFEEFGKRAPSTKGQPDETRIEKARQFAREVMSGFSG